MRKNPEKSHPESPWFLFRLSPAYFLCHKTRREPVLPRLYLRFLCPCEPTHTHVDICTDKHVCACGRHRERAGLGAGTAGLRRPRSPAFPGETGAWPGRAPGRSCSLLRGAPGSNGTPPSGRGLRLEEISPARKRVGGILSSVSEGLSPLCLRDGCHTRR